MVDKRNLFLIGPMGAGKSTIGRQLAKELNMDFYDSDQEIEKRTGVDISWVFDIEGEEGFRKREEKIINELTSINKIVLATGGGSILSKKIRNVLSARGIIIYLKVTIEQQLIRTKMSKNRPLLNGSQPKEVILKDISIARNPLYEEISDIIVHTDNKSTKAIVYQILNDLKKI
ncbi:Shikimate kinase 1 [Buchnera aphidicola (Pterocallis alni)]|uniref:shikimate kinase AroK n=1 Tax=Buchnera aphidicola TaxID=9 RepID=UPI003463E909